MTQGTKKGFTIMELMLAMGVIAFLLIAVAGLIIQMTNTITRGTTYRDLNAASRTINADFTKTFNSAPMPDGWTGGFNDNGFYKSMGASSATGGVTRESGAFCLGTVSYIWNTGNSNQITYSDGSPVKLAKVRDSKKEYCENNAENTVWKNVPRNSTVTEVLTGGEIGLQLHRINFSTSPSLKSSSSNQMIVNISYILGTPTNGDINVSTYNCEGNVKSNYCAINRFDLTVRTLGR